MASLNSDCLCFYIYIYMCMYCVCTRTVVPLWVVRLSHFFHVGSDFHVCFFPVCRISFISSVVFPKTTNSRVRHKIF